MKRRLPAAREPVASAARNAAGDATRGQYPPPVITTASLSNATEGAAYNESLAATGLVTAWSLESGTLPDGVTLGTDGVLSGTPTENGEFGPLVFRATGPGGFDEVSLNLTVDPPDPTPEGYHELGTFRFASNYSSSDTSADLTAQSVQVAVGDAAYNPDTGEYIIFTFVVGNIVSYSRHEFGSLAAAISSATVWTSYRPD